MVVVVVVVVMVVLAGFLRSSTIWDRQFDKTSGALVLARKVEGKWHFCGLGLREFWNFRTVVSRSFATGGFGNSNNNH